MLLDEKAKEWVAEKGYDPIFGARPLKRFLQPNLETRLARGLIRGEIAEGTEVKFTIENDELAITGPLAENAPPPKSEINGLRKT